MTSLVTIGNELVGLDDVRKLQAVIEMIGPEPDLPVTEFSRMACMADFW